MTERLQVRAQDLSWEQLDDEVVILDLVGSTYLKLNGPGAVLWHALLDGAERVQLVDALLREYEIDPATAANDVEAFLDHLSRAGLVEAVNPR